MSDAAVPQAQVANPVQAALDAFKSGKDPEAAVYGTPSNASSPPSTKVAEPAPGAALDSPTQEAEDSNPVTEAAENEAAPEAEAKAEDNQELPAEEDVIVTDETGSRRRLKVSYTDRAKIKKAYEMAAGMRKAFSERDQLKQRLSGIEGEFKDLKSSWSALEEAFGKQGVAGVINLLGGSNDAFEKYIAAEVDKRNKYAIASPEERAKMDLEAQLEAERAEKKALMEKVQADLQRSEEAKKSAEQKQAESVLYPTFDKYRFTGKLGDASLEEQLDTAIWTQAREKLLALPDDTEITPAMVDKAFRETANVFRKAIDKQASTKVQQTVAKRKVAAQEAAAAAVQNTMKAGAQTQASVQNYMKTNDFGGLFRDVFSGKIKL